MNTKIICHHIGARGYGVSFNVPPQFKDEVTFVLYDADADAIKELEDQKDSSHSAHLGETKILPYCIGRCKEERTLNITANSYASSVLEPDPNFFKFISEIPIGAKTFDVTYPDMMEVVRQVTLNTHSIDELFSDGVVSADLSPDFLSVDAQGLEHDIFNGARKTLNATTLALVSEIEFLPMYKNQPLFADILKIADDLGFYFAGYTYHQEVAPIRLPIGLRGKGIPGFGDALFLRKIDNLPEMFDTPDALFVAAYKLAFISFVYGHFEYGFSALSIIANITPSQDVLDTLEKHNYFRFLREAGTVAGLMEKKFPMLLGIPPHARAPEIVNTYVHPELGTAEKPSQSTSRAAAFQVRLRRHAYRTACKIMKNFSGSTNTSSTGAITAAPAPVPETSFETLLRRYGFEANANMVSQRRIAAENGLAYPHEFI